MLFPVICLSYQSKNSLLNDGGTKNSACCCLTYHVIEFDVVNQTLRRKNKIKYAGLLNLEKTEGWKILEKVRIRESLWFSSFFMTQAVEKTFLIRTCERELHLTTSTWSQAATKQDLKLKMPEAPRYFVLIS